MNLLRVICARVCVCVWHIICVSFSCSVNTFSVNLLCVFSAFAVCVCVSLCDLRMVGVSCLCVFHYCFNEPFVCFLHLLCVCDVYFPDAFMNLLCACVFLLIFPILFCEPVVCVSAFIVCVLCVCFVYGLCIALVWFHCFFFVNWLCVFLQLSCVFALVLRRVCVPFVRFHFVPLNLLCSCSAFDACVLRMVRV